jgi:hypothetical protein
MLQRVKLHQGMFSAIGDEMPGVVVLPIPYPENVFFTI